LLCIFSENKYDDDDAGSFEVKVTLRRAGLVLKWVTMLVFDQAIQANSACPSLRGYAHNDYWRQLWSSLWNNFKETASSA